MEDFKVLAKVKFNDSFAYVLNRDPVYKYKRIKNLIYAQDGPFISCYGYETPTKFSKAFSGREFFLDMEDGTKTHCKGQWWDKGQAEISKHLNINMIKATLGTEERLLNCYCYYGTQVVMEEIELLDSQYKGTVYEYNDYEAILHFKHGRQKLWRENDELIKQNKSLSKQVKETEERCEYRVKGLISEVKRKDYLIKNMSKMFHVKQVD